MSYYISIANYTHRWFNPSACSPFVYARVNWNCVHVL